ncbi:MULTISPECIES: hypothetical protein [unclassified Streptomyces]|uniref:hypothetical protein n=1 Tax=unclassified Streptomyces TaxID=2593676 RepID=UPI000823F88D|nr:MULTISPECIES: hypothetical protein [unclassified Streptomyces]MYT96339.1 hypothetical protein [Streptomyces sp. SID8350]SCK62134.1 hypothetical protein YUWDRAFT_06348 [Streptomyces sp. AmelKG-D3]
MTASAPVINPGDVRTRKQIREVFGGSPQGGICPSVGKLSVNLYSDPDVGERVGYYDGWLAEEDELGPVFEYTGAGKSGDQTFEGDTGTGNKAILKHAEQGRTLRVFTQVGKVPGSDTKTHRYLGSFTLDSLEPYVWRRALGEDKKERNVIVFRLRAEGPVQHAAEDMIPPAEETTAKFVPFQAVTAAMFQSDPATSGDLPVPKQRSAKTSKSKKPAPNSETSGTFVVPETFGTKLSLRAATAATVAVRHEAELTQSYKDFLESAGHQTGAFQIKVKGLTSTLRTDLYDATDHVLYEAKGSNSREDVRMALGQILDYSRYVRSQQHEGEPKRVILLPSAPAPDMYSLLDRYDVGVVYRSDDGRFVDAAKPGD